MSNSHQNTTSNGRNVKPIVDSFKVKFDINEELDLAKRMFGRSLSQQLSLEFEACRQIGRLPPMASSSLMTETLLGTDESIGLNYLNNPLHDEKIFDFAKSVTK